MEYLPTTYVLKSRKSIKIRVAEATDAQDLLNLKRDYIRDTQTIPMSVDEYHNDMNNEASLIADYFASSNSILLVAEYDNVLIGNIDLTGSKRSIMSHTGMIGMGIKEEWRNQGLGRFLIESIIDWAISYSELKLIWLDVYASNVLGVNLYKNTGFKISGIIKDFFKQENGYIDKIQMYQCIR